MVSYVQALFGNDVQRLFLENTWTFRQQQQQQTRVFFYVVVGVMAVAIAIVAIGAGVYRRHNKDNKNGMSAAAAAEAIAAITASVPSTTSMASVDTADVAAEHKEEKKEDLLDRAVDKDSHSLREEEEKDKEKEKEKDSEPKKLENGHGHSDNRNLTQDSEALIYQQQQALHSKIVQLREHLLGVLPYSIRRELSTTSINNNSNNNNNPSPLLLSRQQEQEQERSQPQLLQPPLHSQSQPQINSTIDSPSADKKDSNSSISFNSLTKMASAYVSSALLMPQAQTGNELYQYNMQMLDELINISMSKQQSIPLLQPQHSQPHLFHALSQGGIETEEQYNALMQLNQKLTTDLQKNVAKVMAETGMESLHPIRLFEQDSTGDIGVPTPNADAINHTQEPFATPSSSTATRLEPEFKSSDENTLKSAFTLTDVVNNMTKQIEQKDVSLRQQKEHIKKAYKELIKHGQLSKTQTQPVKTEIEIPVGALARTNVSENVFTELGTAAPQNNNTEETKEASTKSETNVETKIPPVPIQRAETLSYIPTVEDVTQYVTQRTDMFVKKLAMLDLADTQDSDDELLSAMESDADVDEVEAIDKAKQKKKEKKKKYQEISLDSKAESAHIGLLSSVSDYNQSIDCSTDTITEQTSTLTTETTIQTKTLTKTITTTTVEIEELSDDILLTTDQQDIDNASTNNSTISFNVCNNNNSVTNISRTTEKFEPKHARSSDQILPAKQHPRKKNRSCGDTTNEVTWLFQEMQLNGIKEEVKIGE